MRYIFSVFFSIAIIFSVFAQELPPIATFESAQYRAGNQNWMIAQDRNGFMYMANHSGLLEYNGSSWKLYHTPNETTMRSVAVVGNTVYTGCYMDFGYWNRDDTGILVYHSISKTIQDKIKDDEQFWNIIPFNDVVVFQSLDQLFIYHPEKKYTQVISPKEGVIKAYSVAGNLYYQTINRGLFLLQNGKSVLVSDDDVFKRTKIVNLFKTENGFIVHTQFEGLFELSNGKLKAMQTRFPVQNIYSSLQLSNNQFAIGTVSNGVYRIDAEGNTIEHINQQNGLNNNTVLSLFEDNANNLWVGLDNGINCINLDASVLAYTDDSGKLGTIYTSALFQNNLYLGTNQGLFVKPFGQEVPFTLVEGTRGQVWSLFKYENTLFCGHDTGTYVVENGSAERIFSESGTWTFTAMKDNPNVILQGNYYGLSVLKKQNNTWVFANRVEGFSYSTRYLEVLDHTAYVSHEYKGVFQIQLDETLQKVKKWEMLSSPKKGKNAGLVKFKNKILFASKDGVYTLTNIAEGFQKDSTLSAIVANENYTSGKMTVDEMGKLWVYTKNHINYFSSSTFSEKLEHKAIPISYDLANAMSGYENITLLDANKQLYILGTVNGYYLFTPNNAVAYNYTIFLTSAEAYRLNASTKALSFQNPEQLSYKENNINFSFTIPQYRKYANTEYQYSLEGLNEGWSALSMNSSVSFKNLAPGDYVFKVKGKVADNESVNTISYPFTIQQPWFATYWATIIYVVLLVVLAVVINTLYKRFYDKQKLKLIASNQRKLEMQKLETKEQLTRAKNEILEKDIESKNRELAASTLNLIKKNETLSAIKTDLKKLDSTKNVKSIITTINANINEEDTWNLFSEAFNNADKDFLKKIKELHPKLTPNDLRLCAYLRLNLSSKEIAPLLNISVRSVEIKRYRLRKKMELEHDQSLVDYILSV